MSQLELFYFKHNKNTIPTHITKRPLPYYDLTIVLKGSLCYIYKDQTIPIRTGNAILMRPGEYRQRLDSDEVSDYISFNFTCDLDLQSIPTITENFFSSEINHLLIACDEIVYKMPDKYEDKISLILGAILLQMLDIIRTSQFNTLTLQIKNYILQNPYRKITLNEISTMFHYSSSYCNVVFKKETQMTIIDFIINERIQHAKELLIYTSLSLTQTSQKVGYDDYNYFSRLFKKYTNYSPVQYRKLYSK